MLFKILLLAGFLTSVFTFFKLVRDDIKLVSLSIQDAAIFDMFFLTSLGAVLGARLIYYIEHFSQFGANPLKFFLITYFPGLSWSGAILGGSFFLWWFLKKKNILRIRIFDLAVLSALPIILLGLLGSLALWQFLVFTILTIVFFAYYGNPRRFLLRLNFPGIFFLVFLMVSSLLNLVVNFAIGHPFLINLLTLEQILNLAILLVAIYSFLRKAIGREYI